MKRVFLVAATAAAAMAVALCLAALQCSASHKADAALSQVEATVKAEGAGPRPPGPWWRCWARTAWR